MSKTCLECEEEIKGRADKKFCSDQCRNAYNNKLKSGTSDYVRSVNNALKKNRKILQELLPEATCRTTRSKLLQKGFDFNFMTSSYTNRKNATYYFCYEYGYLPLENDLCFLVRRKEYMDN